MQVFKNFHLLEVGGEGMTGLKAGWETLMGVGKSVGGLDDGDWKSLRVEYF